jgi:hypothetical protein
LSRGIGLLVLLIGFSGLGSGQACPSPGDLARKPPEQCGQQWVYPTGWQDGATITVYIVSNPVYGIFLEAQVNAIENAYNNWNARVGSHLTFNFVEVPTLPVWPREPYSAWEFGSTAACTSSHLLAGRGVFA